MTAHCLYQNTYDPGISPGSANQCILGEVYQISEIQSIKGTQQTWVKLHANDVALHTMLELDPGMFYLLKTQFCYYVQQSWYNQW